MGGSTALKIKTNDRLCVPRYRRTTPAEREREGVCFSYLEIFSCKMQEGRARTLMAMRWGLFSVVHQWRHNNLQQHMKWALNLSSGYNTINQEDRSTPHWSTPNIDTIFLEHFNPPAVRSRLIITMLISSQKTVTVKDWEKYLDCRLRWHYLRNLL